ncbi:hypothetical protein [Moorena producens]|uniref:hypothetical protein n=1 Tax=Moorena producens TaxID=1155739 RepID=UPI003C7336E2
MRWQIGHATRLAFWPLGHATRTARLRERKKPSPVKFSINLRTREPFQLRVSR